MKKSNSPIRSRLFMFAVSVITASLVSCGTSKKSSATASGQVAQELELEPPTPAPDVLPEYNGGQQGILQYLRTSIVYPREARENRIEGRVLVQFVIEKDGRVTNPKVTHSVNYLLDAEALRVIGAMSKWTPGKVNDEPVRVLYTIPVTFRLK